MKNQIFIELCVQDIDSNIDFFTTIFGFSCDKNKEGFAELHYEDSRMLLNIEKNYKEGHHFSNKINQDSNGYGVEIGIQVSDIEEIHTEAKKHSMVKAITEVREQPWGSKDFRIVTKDNYYLRITQKMA